jgi:hypothetical protein
MDDNVTTGELYEFFSSLEANAEEKKGESGPLGFTTTEYCAFRGYSTSPDSRDRRKALEELDGYKKAGKIKPGRVPRKTRMDVLTRLPGWTIVPGSSLESLDE